VVSIPLSSHSSNFSTKLTHGFTQYASKLVYLNEPGALDEALSDIMGAAVEGMYMNKSVADTFLVAEDIFIEGGGRAVRNMAGATCSQNQGSKDLHIDTHVPLTKLLICFRSEMYVTGNSSTKCSMT
jgi:Zn-dependent metalloprotease